MIRNIILSIFFLNTLCWAEDQKPDSFDFNEKEQHDDQIESDDAPVKKRTQPLCDPFLGRRFPE